MNTEVKFLTKSCSTLNDREIAASSQLFSEHYGIYSQFSKIRPGERIKLGTQYYKTLRDNKNHFVSMAYYNDVLVGQAYYFLMDSEQGMISWVLQLVVHSDYRRRRIAERLLYSVWGFSNYRAWGLATVNPLTIKTLESATFRSDYPAFIAKKTEIINIRVN